MIDGKRVLAVVPARSGSKGVPDKNMRSVGGKTLIQRAAETLAAVEILDRCVISTDSKEYAAHAVECGLEAPFLRPPALSTDTAGSVEATQHALRECEKEDGVKYDLIVLAPPTSPLRKPSDIRAAIGKLLETGAEAALTVSKIDAKFSPMKLLTFADGRVGFYHPKGASVKVRQGLETYYYQDGLCYVVTRDCLIEKRAFITANTAAVVTERPVVNIDEPIELAWTEFLLERGP